MKASDARVLVVEDNVNNYNLILRLLTFMGVEYCEWIRSGWKVASEADQYSPIHLILLDIQLPYEDGFEVHRKLREHPSYAGTRIIAVTANASESYMRRAKSEGFDGFIGKPLDPERFPAQVQRILDGEPVWEWH